MQKITHCYVTRETQKELDKTKNMCNGQRKFLVIL